MTTLEISSGTDYLLLTFNCSASRIDHIYNQLSIEEPNAMSCSPLTSKRYIQRTGKISSVKMVSVGWTRSSYPSLRSSHLQICCAAKPETVAKVCEIVKKQLALSDEIALTPESKFSALGADSLDTVEIVMGLEEEFDINVEEDNSQYITTVQEAADLIEKLVQQKSEAA